MAPSSSPPPPKKLLITGPRPKSGPNSASSSSATTTLPLPEKRTRDQPNLSDCHCCGRRIIHTNPKDRLQPLDSVWRIVLLCRKCRRSICSGQTCPYCFQATGNSGDICTCRVCQRKIHKDCVRDYVKCTPWRHLGAGFEEGFRVCVDCWVPESLKNSVQVLGRSENRGELKDKDEFKDNGICEAERNLKKAGKAKEQVSRRGKGASDEGDSVDGASGFLAKPLGNSNYKEVSNIRNWKGLYYKRSGLGKRCSEDQQLEIHANSDVNGRMKGNDTALVPYRRDRKRKIWSLDNGNAEISESTSSQQAVPKSLHSNETGVGCLDEARIWCSFEAAVGCSLKSGADTLDHSILADIRQGKSCIDGGRIGHELICYQRTRFRNGPDGVSGDISSCGNPEVALEPECGQSDCANLKTSSVVKGHSEVILLTVSSDRERDRFHLKYVKRITGTKTNSSFQRYGTFLSENQVSAPAVNYSDAVFPVNDCKFTLPNEGFVHAKGRYSFKYAKRVKRSNTSSKNSLAKLHSVAFLDEN